MKTFLLVFLCQPFPLYEPYNHPCFESMTQLQTPKEQKISKTMNTLSASITPQINCTASTLKTTHHGIFEKKNI